jgi:DNA-binding response OmpR family regulator
VLTVGPLRLAVHQRRVWLHLQELQLTAREFDLLACLMRNRGVVVRREQLFREVWGGRVPGISQTLSVHIRWLRRKIEVDPDNPIYIQTVRQIGYRIDNSDAVVAKE